MKREKFGRWSALFIAATVSFASIAQNEAVFAAADDSEEIIEATELTEGTETTEVIEETESGNNIGGDETEIQTIDTQEVMMVSEETAADKFDYEFITNEDGTETVEITKYTGSETVVVIPEQIDGKSVTNIGRRAFYECSNLTSVTIPKGVTNIGDSAFGGCRGLTSVTIPKGVTRIGDGAFWSCTGLTSIVIPKGVKNIGECTFGHCSGLTSVALPKGLKNIGDGAFDYCSNLTSITIPKGVISIEMGAFYSCSNLASAIIPESVTVIGDGAFGHCEKLTIYAKANSYAIRFAEEYDIPYELLENEICTHAYTELRNVVAATCTREGYTGDTYCEDCGEKLSSGETVAALGHSYTSMISRQPTVTEEGVKTYTCSRCRDSYTEPIAKIIVSYTVTFNGNGATKGSMNSQSVTYGSEVRLNTNKFAKKNYIFIGWNTKKDGSGTAFADEADASKLTTIDGETITLYAQWAAGKYTITFNGNGSTSGSMKKLSGCKYGTKYTLTKNAFKKTGYTFAGWNTKKDGSGTSYKNKEKVKNLSAISGKSVTLYAQWKEITYKVTYKMNKGRNNKKNPSSYTVTTKTIMLKKPMRKGYTFAGWYSDKKCTKKVTKIQKGSTGNITLYAKWKKK